MTVFADSSALVKLYADEEGSDEVRSHDVLVMSALARVEVLAAIWRKVRTGAFAPADAALLVSGPTPEDDSRTSPASGSR